MLGSTGRSTSTVSWRIVTLLVAIVGGVAALELNYMQIPLIQIHPPIFNGSILFDVEVACGRKPSSVCLTARVWFLTLLKLRSHLSSSIWNDGK